MGDDGRLMLGDDKPFMEFHPLKKIDWCVCAVIAGGIGTLATGLRAGDPHGPAIEPPAPAEGAQPSKKDAQPVEATILVDRIAVAPGETFVS